MRPSALFSAGSSARPAGSSHTCCVRASTSLARRASEIDARTQHVWLQPAGRALLPALNKALGRINESLTGTFTPAELQTVARWLEHVQTLGDADE